MTAPGGIGVPTTTPLAFYHAGQLELGRMNLLAEDGCGVLSEAPPATGARVQIAFRLSTRRQQIRCQAEVLATLPTTPAGLELRQRGGAQAFKVAMSAAVADSATAIFRVSELERPRRAPAAPAELGPQVATAGQLPAGFCLRFVDLSATDREHVVAHLRLSRRLSEQLAAREGRLVALGPDERQTMAAYFDEGDLRKKAEDW